MLRFPVRDLDGAPIAICRVAAPGPEAAIARAEGERLLRTERWARLSDAAIRAEVLDEWKLSKLVAEPVLVPEPVVRPMRDAEPAADAAAASASSRPCERSSPPSVGPSASSKSGEERARMAILQATAAAADCRVDEIVRAEAAARGRSGRSVWLVDLASARGAQIAAAASAGMRAALLVPIRHGEVTIGVLELLTRAASPPNPELTAATEAVALQLAHFDHLLRRGAEPRWKLGRM